MCVTGSHTLSLPLLHREPPPHPHGSRKQISWFDKQWRVPVETEMGASLPSSIFSLPTVVPHMHARR